MIPVVESRLHAHRISLVRASRRLDSVGWHHYWLCFVRINTTDGLLSSKQVCSVLVVAES